MYRQKNIVDQKTRATEKILDKHFLFWRYYKSRYAWDAVAMLSERLATGSTGTIAKTFL